MYDTNQKSKPHVALCGAFVGKGKPLGGNKTTPDRATQRLYEPQPLDSVAVWNVQESLPCDFEIAVVEVGFPDVIRHPVFGFFKVSPGKGLTGKSVLYRHSRKVS